MRDMIKEFRHLKPEEQDLLYKAPIMVTILIAGADNDIDEQERHTAEKLAKYRSIAGDQHLLHFYEDVHKDFEKRLIELIREYPKLANLRNPIISKQLEMLNEILPKLHKSFAVAYYESLRSYARRVAESSGGFLGFMRVGSEEKSWIDLPMIMDPGKE